MGVGLRASTRYCAPVERSRAGPFASGGDPAPLTLANDTPVAGNDNMCLRRALQLQ
jgi:hypothetical protein